MSVKETPEQIDRRLALERKAGEMAQTIGDACPPGVGYALLIFSFGQGGNLAYMSNGDRDDVARVLREWLTHYERGQT